MDYEDYLYHRHMLWESYYPLFDKYKERLNFLFRRGSLAIMELCGIILVIRSLIFGVFDLQAGIIGAVLLVVGSILEYLILKTTVSFHNLAVENEEMRLYLRMLHKERPRGISDYWNERETVHWFFL